MPISLAVRKPPSELSFGKPGFRLCVGFEGLHLTAYPDPASRRGRALQMEPHERPAGWETFPGDPWTIGYGHTKGVKEGDTCTLAQADAWLLEDIEHAVNIVRSQIQVPLTPGEFDALVSLVYNLGYIPKSMKACLNGGVTDKGVQMSPGSYGSALAQFPRNCRAAGVPMRGLLRRRLAEACVFSDLPWEAACSKNIIKLELDHKGNPDPNGTTSLEETLARARQDIPIMRPDPTPVLQKPWSELVPAKPIDIKPADDTVDIAPTQLPELEQPALVPVPDEVADGREAAPVPPPVASGPKSTPASVESSGPGGSGQAAAKSTVPPASPPPVPKPSVSTKPPPPPVVIAPKTIDVRSIPYGEINVENGVKNMTDTQRAIGLVIVGIGSIAQVLSTREIISSTYAAVFHDLSRDTAFVAMATGAIVLVIGWLTRKRGKQVMVQGMVNAQHLMK